jgi:rhodanese-related sulfurtransferase
MMNRRKTFVLFVGFLAMILATAACASSGAEQNTTAADSAKNSDGYTDITVDQLNQMMESKDFTLVNVHIPYEGDLPNTDLSIPYNDLESHLDQLPEDKNAPLVLYCRSGSMSTQAAETLVDLGYTNIMEVDGGMNAWRSAGYDLLIE